MQSRIPGRRLSTTAYASTSPRLRRRIQSPARARYQRTRPALERLAQLCAMPCIAVASAIQPVACLSPSGLQHRLDGLHVALLLRLHVPAEERRCEPQQAVSSQVHAHHQVGSLVGRPNLASEADLQLLRVPNRRPCTRTVEAYVLDRHRIARYELRPVPRPKSGRSVTELLDVLEFWVPLRFAREVASVIEHLF